MRRFYAHSQQFSTDRVTLGPEETRHIRDVLRLHVGDDISVFDGSGSEFRCSITGINRKSVEASVIERISPSSPESPLELVLAAAMLKGEKFDLVVQKATELGVSRVIPLQTIRCDIRNTESIKRVERWQRIALEATKQCGRATLMTVDEAVRFEQLVPIAAKANSVLFSEQQGQKLGTVKSGRNLLAIVGPEGGWDASELDTANKAGIPIITLGGRILKAETAAIAIAAILQHRFGDLN